MATRLTAKQSWALSHLERGATLKPRHDGRYAVLYGPTPVGSIAPETFVILRECLEVAPLPVIDGMRYQLAEKIAPDATCP